jgi:serine/threonine-protein kinase HSL1 (negative regulator of Swe1 kinase)
VNGLVLGLRDIDLTLILAPDTFDDTESIVESITANRHSQRRNSQEPRHIEPQRNWLAKLFNVKPVAKLFCFSISKQKARQEIVNILKDWKQYGIRDIQVDRERNIVFGRVATKNCKFHTKIDHF